MATISIVVTVYNKAPWLERCLGSLIEQTDKDFEVIIVDDGSTDGGNEICKKLAKANGWRLFLQAHAGVSVARNFGIDKATGDYIAFLDADDSYTEDAIKVMKNMAKDFKYNIIQFGQYRNGTSPHRQAPRGDYELPNCTVEFWEFTTNKLYNLRFLRENKIRFIEGLQFGEDELFNVEAFIANHGFRQAAVKLYNHYFDDKQSLCRGGLDLDKLKVLDDLLRKRIAKLAEEAGEGWVDGAEWLIKQCRVHYESRTFERFGFKQRPAGNHDVVYFLKEGPNNEELRYSLRSVDQNWPYRSVWFYGGCPVGITPDHYEPQVQNSPTKWQNVRNMMREVCLNDEITEDFWLFNDDFFILQPMDESITAFYDGTLTSKVDEIKSKYHGEGSEWSNNLELLKAKLKKAKKPELNYAVHAPMLFNRKKLLKVLDKYLDEPMVRALYGNWWRVPAEPLKDPKYSDADGRNISDQIYRLKIISTSDDSFRGGYVGRWLRDRFQTKSRFEG